jgi:hypothetical protein
MPWSTFWEQNYFGSVFPTLRPWLTNDFLRGAVSGLGVLNLLAGFAELAPVFGPRGRRSGALDPQPSPPPPFQNSADTQAEP